jgi:hypothetical protein
MSSVTMLATSPMAKMLLKPGTWFQRFTVMRLLRAHDFGGQAGHLGAIHAGGPHQVFAVGINSVVRVVGPAVLRSVLMGC